MRRNLGKLAAIGALGVLIPITAAACGGDSDDDDGGDGTSVSSTSPSSPPSSGPSASTATPPTTAGPATIAAPAPAGDPEAGEAAFLSALQAAGIDESRAQFAAGIQVPLCRSLTSIPDSQEDVLAAAYPGLVTTLGEDDAATVLSATATHLCPEHAGAIEDFLAAQG